MKNVLEYLENSVLKFPNKKAAADEFGSCTYEQLSEGSRRVGTYLTQALAPRSPVPVFMDKGINALKTFFGAAYAGCFYVLINPQLPSARIEHILKTLNAKIIVTEESGVEKFRELGLQSDIEILTFENMEKTDVDDMALQKIRDDFIDIDPLYANFTSGSTGVPKGVLISHRSVIDFIDNFTEIFDFSSDDIIGNQAPFDFDVSVKDIYSSLKMGATLEIIPKSLFSSPAQLLDYICEKEVSVMTWAVSALCLISAFHGLDYKVPTSVKKILFSGETMPLKHLQNWMNALPDAQFVNLYGPTEITCNCTYYKVRRDEDYQNGLPIGKAFPNERVFLLDDENNLITKENATGEICVAGTALGLGYYNNREQTDKAFVKNPLTPYYNEMIYKTGDLAYYGENGNLYFSGRKDFQIKYMGHRIELEEIEKSLSAVENVERACCLFLKEKNKLCAFFVGETTGKEIRQCLSKTLPVYMIPTSYVKLEEMPITKNGKIDRAKLAQMKTR